MRFLKRLFWLMILVAMLAAGAVAAAAWWWLEQPLPLASPSVEVSIEPRTSPREAAQAWVQAGVQTDARLLYEWFRWSGQARKIRAGSYQVGTGVTPRTLLDKMVKGDEVMATV
ncbi:MAG TPA: aminodeoxychorismate lyase, partial [Rhizobacter sp.]